MLKTSSLAKWGVAVLLLSSLSSCEDIFEQYFPKPNPTPPTNPTFPGLGLDIPFYTLSNGTKLDAYSTANPSTRTSSIAVTGLGSGETLLAIDFRPATGQLYGVSSASRLYVINQNTGAARAIGAGAFTPAVSGNLVGFDFNPTVDRIRLVTSTGQNLRLNPETGTVAATDGNINGAAGAMLTGVGYTNNTAGAETTALYAINSQNQQLYLVNPPNDGTLVTVGSLNLPVSGDGGFDIDAKTGTALGLYTVAGRPTLFSVDLATGAARPLAQYAANLAYSGIAIPTQPVVYAAGYIFISGRGSANYFYSFDPTNTSGPRDGRIERGISGLGRNEIVEGLDFRPATGQLYALVLGRGGRFLDGTIFEQSTRLYTIDVATGRASRVADVSIPLAEGASYGFSFNPLADYIRIVNTNGRNLRVNPTDGTAVEDGTINPTSARTISVAYNNSFFGATSTNLYNLAFTPGDARTKLYLQNPPNAGTLTEIGNIEVSGAPGAIARNVSHFDIGGTTNTAYGTISYGSAEYAVVNINLMTAKATYLRQVQFNGGPFITGVAVAPGF
jgi:hypothetical protein